MSESTKHPLKLFYCYAHEDKALRDTLDSHLSILKRQKLIEVWYDGKISVGIEWEKEIGRHLRSADIVLLLVSAAFLASDYCYSKEMEKALQRHKEGTARVVPIILRPVYWENAPFSKLQVLPTGARPVISWSNPDEAYKDIAGRLAKVVKELKTSRESPVLTEKGIARENVKRHEEVILACDHAIRLNPNDVNAYNRKGFALNELKRYDEAILALDHAIRIDPHYASAYNKKGFALNELKRYDEAILAFDQAIRIDPHYASAHNRKGFALNELKRYEDAILAFDQAIRLNPKHVSAQRNKGIALNELKRYEDAILAFDQALRFDPQDAESYNGKGVALHGLKQYEKAILTYDQALRLNPNLAITHHNKALALKALAEK